VCRCSNSEYLCRGSSQIRGGGGGMDYYCNGRIKLHLFRIFMGPPWDSMSALLVWSPPQLDICSMQHGPSA